jgi:hypothetical protein
MAKKTNAFGKILCVSGLLALAGLIVYLINTLTGYMSSLHTAIAPLVVILPAVAILCAVFLTMKPTALKGLTGIATFVLAVLMGVATVFFVKERVDVIGDMLNPVNHPDTQKTAVILSIVGIALYFLSFLGLVITTGSDKLAKE